MASKPAEQRQELMTAEQANAIKSYHRDTELWQHDKTAKSRGVLLAVLVSLGLWALSFYASAYADGDSIRQTWLKLFTLGAFITAGVVTIIAITLALTSSTTPKPVRPAIYEDDKVGSKRGSGD